MQSLPPALSPLGAWAQFVCWFAVPHPTKPGKFNKFPCNWQTGEVVDAHDPQHWTTVDVALAMAAQWDRGHGGGAGFVFTANDPYFFHDIDGAWTAADAATGAPGAWSPLALDLCARFQGCAIEVSHSGRGLHIIGRTAALTHGTKNTPLGLELYTSGRFVALTGLNCIGNADHDATVPLAAVAAEFFPQAVSGEWEGWTSEPVAGYTGPPEDDELLRRALASAPRSAAAAFGAASQPTFADLWEARADVLAAWRPQADAPDGFGRTEADQALANMLAFWTGKNCERMERLMRRSALTRDKWDVHRTYLADTIVKACAFVQQIYSQAPAGPPLIAPVDHATIAAAAQATGRKMREANREYMGPLDQLSHFEGCYYDNATSKIYSFAKNEVFEKSAFDVNYGGHMFILDPANQKTTDSAWEAFTKSRVYEPVIVSGLRFRPELTPGVVMTEGSRKYVNSYVPHHCSRLEGDAGPMLRHIEKLLPVAYDRTVLMSYLASMAQNPGRKFQWWPVIQGAEGNGKTFLIRAMTHVFGHEYTHLPNVHKMAKSGSNFNSWIYRKLFIGMEEVSLSHRRDFLEEFKIVVTNDRMEIEGKGENQFMGDNAVNGLLMTNHRDGVPVTVDSRRYSIFYTAQQSAEDCERDGMTQAYFADLWDWFRGRGAYAAGGEHYGAAIFANHLLTMEIAEEFDPAKLSTRAPKTSSTDAAIKASLGMVEQEVMDAISEGRPGFAGGWVSSYYLDLLIDQLRARIPRNKRRDMMAVLGYDYHPALTEGRTNEPVTPDNRKPRLYVKRGHLALNVSSPADVARLYSKAQEQNAAPSAAAVAFGGSHG